jgi:DNA-directed RNA polymerase specialized sigma24 family protein
MSTIVDPSEKSIRSAPDGAVSEATRNSQLSRLVRRVADGDRSAFAELFDMTAERLIAAMRSRLRDPDVAAEVATETLVEVWWMARHHVDDRGTNAAAAWIVEIAARRAEERARPGRQAPDVPGAGGSVSPALVDDVYGRGMRLMLDSLLGRPAATLVAR